MLILLTLKTKKKIKTMNKSQEAVMKIEFLTDAIESCSATDEEKKEMGRRLISVTLAMMESHMMVANCKRLLMQHGIIKD